MKKIRFCTMYLPCSNTELAKDVGQIPYTLAKFYNMETSIACYNLNRNGINSEILEYVKYYKVKKILNNNYLSAVLFILKNARKFDWLNLYHGGRFVYYISKLYKIINPNGKVYLKLDMDFRLLDLYEKNEKERKIFSKVSKSVDYISVETECLKERVQQYSSKTISVLGNGFYFSEESLPNVNKENIFLTVGRLGTKQKATEILLEAFAQTANFHNAKLVLIGSVENKFETYITEFFEKYKYLKDRIIFKGEIKERKKLMEQYARAKVFVLSSRWEGFPLVGPEAMRFGCRMIVSDAVPPAEIFTNNGLYGRIFRMDDVNTLADYINQEANRKVNDYEINKIREYASSVYSWDKNCRLLAKILNNQN